MKNRIKNHDNWATPKEFYNTLDSEFHFDFDPCPLNHKFDGLKCSWGKRNFVNPPYSRKLKEAFIRKGFNEWKHGKTIVFLLPVSTSTKIFHEIVKFGEIRFIKGRIKFQPNGKKCNKAGQMDSMIVIFKRTTKS